MKQSDDIEESIVHKGVVEDEEDEDALQMALQLSMGSGITDNNTTTTTTTTATESPQLPHSDFVNELLGSVGVDQNDPLVLAALEQIAQSQAASKEDKRPNPNEGGDENDNKKKRGG